MNVKDYYEKNKRPVCNTIKKILVGKLCTYHVSYRRPLVIVGVRRNPLYGNVQMLLGEWYGSSISIMSWYDYYKNSIMFVGRDSKDAIRKCLKTNPKYISYHVGKRVNLDKMRLYEQPVNYVNGDIIVYDNGNLYKDYLNKV